MTKSWNPKRGKKRYDSASAVVLDRVKLGQAPVSLKRVRWMQRGLWILLALAVVGGGLAVWLTVDARFYIYDAQIDGNRRLSRQEIFKASGLEGLHILWARSGTIESRIMEALPSLESVQANCRLPSECTISVVERRPRILWDEGTAAPGGLWWIDEEGAIFPGTAPIPVQDDTAPAASESGSDVAGSSTSLGMDSGQAESLEDASGRWTVIGPLPREDGRAQGDLDSEVRLALNELWKSGIELPAEFQYTPKGGLSFVDEHGWRIIVGQGSGMARRLQVLDNLLVDLESRGVTPRFVDVRFPEVPYYMPAEE